jgi:hypothetical protein
MKMKIDVQVQKKDGKWAAWKTPPLPSSSSSSSSTVPISLPGSVHTQESLFLSSLIHQMMMMILFLKVKSRNDDCSPCGHWDYELFLSFSFLKNRRQKRTFIFVKEKKAARCTYTHTRE